MRNGKLPVKNRIALVEKFLASGSINQREFASEHNLKRTTFGTYLSDYLNGRLVELQADGETPGIASSTKKRKIKDDTDDSISPRSLDVDGVEDHVDEDLGQSSSFNVGRLSSSSFEGIPIPSSQPIDKNNIFRLIDYDTIEKTIVENYRSNMPPSIWLRPTLESILNPLLHHLGDIEIKIENAKRFAFNCSAVTLDSKMLPLLNTDGQIPMNFPVNKIGVVNMSKSETTQLALFYGLEGATRKELIAFLGAR